jgi:hypothetical protein
MTEKLRRICEEPEVRRELLWLRAQEEGDMETIASLERADPGLRARLEPRLAATRPDRIEDPDERRREYARLWHRRLQDL